MPQVRDDVRRKSSQGGRRAVDEQGGLKEFSVSKSNPPCLAGDVMARTPPHKVFETNPWAYSEQDKVLCKMTTMNSDWIRGIISTKLFSKPGSGKSTKILQICVWNGLKNMVMCWGSCYDAASSTWITLADAETGGGGHGAVPGEQDPEGRGRRGSEVPFYQSGIQVLWQGLTPAPLVLRLQVQSSVWVASYERVQQKFNQLFAQI